jgi:hypothetical protein
MGFYTNTVLELYTTPERSILTRKRDVPEANAAPAGCNIIEFESQSNLHKQINTLIRLVVSSRLTTEELRQLLHLHRSNLGSCFAIQLVSSLQRENEDERQAVIWLLTLLNDPQTIPQLQYHTLNRKRARAIRLAAALALAGMGATSEMTAELPGACSCTR